ncbi:hypothetical protein PG995_013585 [Apiospora arundinis]
MQQSVLYNIWGWVVATVIAVHGSVDFRGQYFRTLDPSQRELVIQAQVLFVYIPLIQATSALPGVVEADQRMDVGLIAGRRRPGEHAPGHGRGERVQHVRPPSSAQGAHLGQLARDPQRRRQTGRR